MNDDKKFVEGKEEETLVAGQLFHSLPGLPSDTPMELQVMHLLDQVMELAREGPPGPLNYEEKHRIAAWFFSKYGDDGR